MTLQEKKKHEMRARNIHESEMVKVQSLTVAQLNFMGLLKKESVQSEILHVGGKFPMQRFLVIKLVILLM